MNGAKALIESLKMEQVTHIFGYAGATICPIADVLLETPEIGYTLVRTEQNAGHMASGYARSSGKVGVCMVTSGPGATNLVTGIATAYLDSIPMVAITGQVPSHQLGHDIFQEVDITGAVAPFSKHSYLVKKASDIPRIVKEAFYIAATGRPGPVLIDIPIDIQTQDIGEFSYPETANIRSYKPSVRGNDLQIKRVLSALESAQRPTLLIGGGVFLGNAQEEALALANALKAPVVTTMMGLSLFPTHHPLNMGMIGAHGTACANKALSKSDLLIMVASRAADRAIVSPEVIGERMVTIHIDVDPAEIGKNMRAEIPLVGDVKTILQQLLQSDISPANPEWLSQMQQMRQEELSAIPATHDFGVSPTRFLRLAGESLGENGIVCVDVGQNQIWTCRNFTLEKGTRLLTSGGLGTMGYALPAAIGAKVAQPEKQVLSICGDGSFQMAMCELAAIANKQMDIKMILFENRVLGLVRQIQDTAYCGAFGVGLDGSPDFAALAAAYQIPATVIETDAQAQAILPHAMQEKGPHLFIVKVHPALTTAD